MLREKVRGRLRKRMSTKDRRILEYLARIAVKYKVDSTKFPNRLVEAWKKDESKCDQLTIRCRKRMEDSAIFLFTTDGKVAAQFPIPTTILQGNDHLQVYMRRCVGMIPARTSSPKKHEGVSPKIKDLKAGMKKVSLKAKVVDIPKAHMIYSRWGTGAYVSNALIADETGTIRISLWNRQINLVSQGDLIEVENGKVASFRGERQLRVGKHGKIGVVQRSREA